MKYKRSSLMIFWVLIAMIVLYGFLAVSNDSLTKQLRKGCVRTNVSRQSDYDNWLAASATRRDSGLQEKDPAARRVDFAGARQYKENAMKPVQANETQGLALSPGSPQISCSGAYPYNLPFPGY